MAGPITPLESLTNIPPAKSTQEARELWGRRVAFYASFPKGTFTPGQMRSFASRDLKELGLIPHNIFPERGLWGQT